MPRLTFLQPDSSSAQGFVAAARLAIVPNDAECVDIGCSAASPAIEVGMTLKMFMSCHVLSLFCSHGFTWDRPKDVKPKHQSMLTIA